MKIYFNKIFSVLFSILIILSSLFIFTACDNKDDKKIKVYIIENKNIETLSLNDYLCGVVAAEIGTSAPIESLKAQTILARTFTIDFLNNNKSKYENSDISNDITEAQAYNKKLINSNIKKAVKETAGLIIKYDNEPIKSYFHSNSGGQTALYSEVFGLNDNDYPYLKSVKTFDKSSVEKWSVTFTKNEILNSLRNMGQSVSNISSFTKGEIGESGRVITFIIGGKEISANTLRINLGSTKLKSTLIDEIILNENSVTFSGYGYGHGVGFDQEYSIYLANQGYNYKQIIDYFFSDITIEEF